VVPKANGEELFLLVLPPAEFARIEGMINSLDRPAKEKRQAIRSFYSSARAVSADKQGRLLLPEDYCRRVELGTEVVLLGGKSRFEIWDAKRWQAASAEAAPILEDIADQIGL
jgi:MraZ protein